MTAPRHAKARHSHRRSLVLLVAVGALAAVSTDAAGSGASLVTPDAAGQLRPSAAAGTHSDDQRASRSEPTRPPTTTTTTTTRTPTPTRSTPTRRPTPTSTSPSTTPSTSPPSTSPPSRTRTPRPTHSTPKPTTSTTSTPTPPPTSAPAGVIAQVLAHINAARASAGLGALTLSTDLSRASQLHNNLMIGGCGLSHQCSGEAGLGDRFSAQGVQWSSAGENIGYGSSGSSDDAIVAAANGLTDSMLAEVAPNDGHRKNLLNSGFTRIGLAINRDSGGLVWMTQDFVN